MPTFDATNQKATPEPDYNMTINYNSQSKTIRKTLNYIGVSMVMFLVLLSCRKESITTDPNSKLNFSVDSILFDTIFTSIGSSTKSFLIYNRNSKNIVVSEIRLATGQASKFRLNIDGIPGFIHRNIEIPAKDSLWVFVEVTLDPNQFSTPLVVSDSIIFSTNGNVQDVNLVAWGQDAYFHYNSSGLPVIVFGQECFSCFEVCNETWQNDKPHVIYGYAIVKEGCKLTINSGTSVNLHNRSGILVGKNATLKVDGTIQSPVNIQGDRLELSYRETPGQWDRILLSVGSVDNEINYAIIKNGNIGIQVDSFGTGPNPALRLSNTSITNMATAGILGQAASIDAYNCVVANAGQVAVALTYGGNYRFRHCTFANYWNYSNRQTPCLLLNNYREEEDGSFRVWDLTNAYFGNCIIYGNLNNEIGIDKYISGAFNYKFEHSLLKIDPTTNTSDQNNYTNIFKNLDPKFKNKQINDFQLDTLSAAKDKGNIQIVNSFPVIDKDLNGNSRINDSAPDLGAFERVE